MSPKLRQQATYDSDEQRVAREFFDIEKWCEIISPSYNEMRVAQKGAVAQSVYVSYQSKKGSRCYFPSAEDYIADFLGIDITDSAQPQNISRQNSNLLHLSLRLFEEAKEQISTGTVEKLKTSCLYCDEQIVTVFVGIFPSYNRKKNKINYNDGPHIISMKIPCNCKNYTIGDIDRIEEKVIEKMSGTI